MDFNPFLNKLITERNSAVVEDPLVDLLAEMVKAIVRLEAQQETPASAFQPTEQPAPSSSGVTETAEETSDTSSGSWSWSFLANPDGSLMWSVPWDILDWLNSLRLHGSEAEGEIGVTLTSKASTPHVGSPSPSTGAPTPARNGRVGECEHEWVALWSTGLTKAECQKCGKVRDVNPPTVAPEYREEMNR